MKDRMILNKVALSGFKSYSSLFKTEIDLRNVNTIIGANGAGKSNLISFLEMISYMERDRLPDFVAKNGYSDGICYYGLKTTKSVLGDIYFNTGYGNVNYTFNLQPSSSGGLYFSEETIRMDKEKELYEKTFRDNGSTSAIYRLGHEGKEKKVVDVWCALRGIRAYHFNDTSMNSGMRMPAYVYDNEFLRENADNLAPFLYEMRENSDKYPYYRRIVETIKSVFPRFDDFDLRPVNVNNTDASIILNWREKGSDKVFGPYSLSDGTLRFIALTTLLLQPVETLPGVIIMDEPEIGLHPYAIKVLSDMIYMASRNAQIIIATQSPMLAEQMEIDDIIVADYSLKDRSSTLRRLIEEELSEWLERYSFEELWEKNVIGGNP